MLDSVFIQEYFRIRSGDTVGLNVDSGWAAAENANATIGTGIEFRIRFKVRETAGGDDASNNYKLQVNRNSAGWNDVSLLSDAGSEAVQAVLSSQFADGDATSTELLTNTATYVNGEGLEDNTSGAYSLTSEETELEWCLWIQSFHDDHLQNVASDTLEFRIVEDDGTVFGGTYTNPTITVSETAGYVGGVPAESPHRVGPKKDTNGNLYVIIEPSGATDSFFPTMIKSTNGGDTWREQDGANRPTEGDLESADIRKVGDTLHIVIQRGASDDVFYHTFRMSDHASADTWGITDEVVTTLSGAASDQEASLEVYADGRVIALYRKTDTNEGVYYKIRSTGGTWGSEVEVDTTASVDFLGGMMIKGESDKMHIFYKDDTNGDLYHKSLPDGGSLGSRESISSDSDAGVSDDEKPIIPPVYWDDGGDEKIMVVYKESADNILRSRIITNDGTPASATAASDVAVASHQAGSNQPVADMVVDGTNALLLYSDRSTFDIFKDENSNGGGWGTDAEEKDGVTAHFIRGNVFTHSSGNGGDKVYGYIWDDGSDGGVGRIFYDEVVLEVGGVGQPTQKRSQGIPTMSGSRDRPGRWN